jgi:hypothetical protein
MCIHIRCIDDSPKTRPASAVPTTLGEWGFSPSVVVATNNPRLCKNQFAASSDSNSLRHKVQCFVDAGSQIARSTIRTMVCSNGSCSKKGTKRCGGCGQVRSVGSLCTHAQ